MTRISKVIIGHKYNMLTPLYVSGRTSYKSLVYRCRCDCGKETDVIATHLTRGIVKSCGCLRGDGRCKTLTYSSWMSAKMRCISKSDEHYKDYGGRGIKMCSMWLNSFDNFLSDMGERPSLDYTLDRIDVNGDYCPENCRWATNIEQQNNKRNNHYIYYNGEKNSVASFARRFNIAGFRVFYGLKKGLSPDEIIEKFKDKPIRHFKRNKKL